MTAPERREPPAPDAAEVAPDSPAAATGSRRRRAVPWLVGGLVVLLAAAGAFYYKTTDDAADQVVLRWRQSPPDCAGAKIRPSRGDSGSGFTPAAVVVTDDFRCIIVVEVLNRSEHTVHLDHAVAQMLGPETGSVVRVDPDAHPQEEHQDDLGMERSGIDAYVETLDPAGLDLEPGSRTSFEVGLVFNPRGCVMGVTMWLDGWPEVHFSVLGREFVRPAANSLAIFHRGQTPGCDLRGDRRGS